MFDLKFVPAPKAPCFNHRYYKKGCPACFDRNRPRTFEELDDGSWIHDRDMEAR